MYPPERQRDERREEKKRKPEKGALVMARSGTVARNGQWPHYHIFQEPLKNLWVSGVDGRGRLREWAGLSEGMQLVRLAYSSSPDTAGGRRSGRGPNGQCCLGLRRPGWWGAPTTHAFTPRTPGRDIRGGTCTSSEGRRNQKTPYSPESP